MWKSRAQEAFFHRAVHDGTHGLTQAHIDAHDAETPADAKLPTYVNARKRLAASLMKEKKS